MKKKSQICFSFAFLFLTCATLFSQQQWANLKFRRYGVEQGLTVTTAFSIVQDDRGFLWIATIDGLQRYDGYKFVAYKTDFNDSTSISDNTVSQLFHGRENKIWAGTYSGGLNCFDVATGKFKRYQNSSSNPNTISSNRIWAIYEDKDGIVWVGTEKGLNRLDVKTGKITRYFHESGNESSLCDDNILSVFKDKSGVLWVGTINGLSRAQTDGGDNITGFKNYKSLSCDSTSLCGNIVMSFYEARNGTMWIGTNDGICRYNAVDNSFHLKRFAPKADTNSRQVYAYLNSYGPNAVRCIYEDKQNNLWLSTDVGLKILDPNTGNYIAYTADPGNTYGLSANLLSGLYEDRSGNLWIGTVVGGLNKVDLKPQKFKVCQTQNGNTCNLSRNNIRSLFSDSRNTLWAGTLEGGLNRMNAKTGKFEQLKNILHSGNVWAIYEDSKKQLWIGSSNGLYRYNDATGETGFYTHDRNDPQSISNNIVRTIFEDSKGNLWIGTEGGLNKYDRHSETFTSFVHDDKDKHSLSHNTVWTIKEGPNALWVGTDNGLNKLIADEKGNLLLFKHYLPEQDNKNSISSRSIRSIWADNGLLWIGTSNGLNKFDVTRETFTRYNEVDGLANSYIYGVLGDDKGNLWISTNNGISCFNKKTAEFHNYDKLDGLQNNEFNTGAYCKSLSGELFFGGPDGFNRFHPDSLYRNKVPPSIVITSIRIFGAELPVGQQNASHLTLNYDQNVISFEFSALDFTVPEKNRYEYMLEGFDKNWVKGDARRFVTYTNLDPGNYKFRVRASNSDGTWNDQGLALDLTIIPPFWKTWWFRLIGLAGLVLLVS
ncbi:MAG: ligand-binding sensor domain-containing protein, partial [Bacteroidia bacterium]